MDDNIHHMKHEFAAKYIVLLFFFFHTKYIYLSLDFLSNDRSEERGVQPEAKMLHDFLG